MSKKATVADSAVSDQSQAAAEPTQQANQQLFEIRDLLFGEQLRAVHQRADEMEAKLQNKLQEMNSLFSTALSTLKQEFTEQLSNHKKQSFLLHQQHTEQLQKNHQELTDSDAHLQAQLQQELDQLTQVVQKNYNDVMAKINTASEELTNNKADRKTLAAMLASMADNLTNQE